MSGLPGPQGRAHSDHHDRLLTPPVFRRPSLTLSAGEAEGHADSRRGPGVRGALDVSRPQVSAPAAQRSKNLRVPKERLGEPCATARPATPAWQREATLPSLSCGSGSRCSCLWLGSPMRVQLSCCQAVAHVQAWLGCRGRKWGGASSSPAGSAGLSPSHARGPPRGCLRAWLLPSSRASDPREAKRERV